MPQAIVTQDLVSGTNFIISNTQGKSHYFIDAMVIPFGQQSVQQPYNNYIFYR